MKEKSEPKIWCNDMSDPEEGISCGGAIAVIMLAVIISAVFSVRKVFCR